jgi:hypothetical protein
MSHCDRVNQVKQEMLARQAHQAQQVMQAKMVKPDHQDQRERKDQQDQQVLTDNPDQQDHQAHLATKERKVFAPNIAPWMVVCSSRMERDDKQYVFNTVLLYTIYDDAQTMPHISYQPTNQDYYTISILITVITCSGFILPS